MGAPILTFDGMSIASSDKSVFSINWMITSHYQTRNDYVFVAVRLKVDPCKLGRDFATFFVF